MQAWRNPNYSAAPVKRILVIAIMPQESYRVTFEGTVANALNRQGYQAMPAFRIFPPGQLNREQVTGYVGAAGIDLVVVRRLSKRTDVQYVSPSVTYVESLHETATS
jgi:hypothetical protein